MDFPGMPEGGPLVVPGPFRFENLTMYTFFCRTEAATNLSLFLPPGFKLWNPLLPTGVILVCIIDYPRVWAESEPTNLISYREACIFIPCFHLKSGPAVYCPFIYLDDVKALAAGREIYGFPKKPAEIEIEAMESAKKGGLATAAIKGQIIIRATWGSEEEEGAPEVIERLLSFTPGVNFIKNTLKKGSSLVGKYLPHSLPFLKVPVLNWRKIPDVTATMKKPVWSVNEVTATRFRIDRIQHLRLLGVSADAVELTGSPTDPLDKFTPIKTLMGVRVDMDFTLPPGKVVQRYGKKK